MPSTESLGVELEELRGALVASGERFVGLVRSLDPEDGQRAVAGQDVTVAELVAGLADVIRPARGGAGDPSPVLGPEPPARLGPIADRLAADLDALAGLLERVADDGRRRSPTGTSLPVVLADVVFDLLVHGFDIAVACRRSWSIPAGRAATVLRVLLPSLSPWVSPAVLTGPEQRVALSFGCVGMPILACVGQGEYRVEAAPAGMLPIRVDPTATLLALAGRWPAPRPAVAQLAGWFAPLGDAPRGRAKDDGPKGPGHGP